MNSITDLQLARLYERHWLPQPGSYHAPAAVVTWDGHLLHCSITGAPLDAAAALVSPDLAEDLAAHHLTAAASPQEPTIKALLTDYDAATAPFRAVAASVAPEAVFRTRLDHGCRRCDRWDEDGPNSREGRGRCNSTQCHCSIRLLWLADDACPEHKWPEEALKQA